MKFEAFLIAVEDIQRAQKFYEEVLDLKVAGDWGENVFFTCGLALQQGFHELLGISEDQIIKTSNSTELVFEEENFDAFVNKLKQYPDLKYVNGGVKTQDWGQRTVHFYDPDGHIIEVGENLKQVTQRFMDSGLTLAQTAKRMGIPLTDAVKLIN